MFNIYKMIVTKCIIPLYGTRRTMYIVYCILCIILYDVYKNYTNLYNVKPLL